MFVKPKSTAGAPNNLAVVTDRRTHAFRFVVLPDGDRKAAGLPAGRCSAASNATDCRCDQRLREATPQARPACSARTAIRQPEIVAERLQAKPQVLNTRLLDRRRQGLAGHRAGAGLRRRPLHLLPVPRQPRGAGRVPCARRRQRDAGQRAHGRRPAGRRPGQPPTDAARRLRRRRRVERGLRSGRRAAEGWHHGAGRPAAAEGRRACASATRHPGGTPP